jgi:hypothetical protein
MNGKVDIPELVKFAAARNVKISIWLYYGSVDAPMEEAVPLYEKWGAVELKIDFIERDDQRGVDWYYRVAKSTARSCRPRWRAVADTPCDLFPRNKKEKQESDYVRQG